MNLIDGPAFTNGEPHYGHLMNRIFKDVLCRYHNIPKQIGFDTHGVPVEQCIKFPDDMSHIMCEYLVQTNTTAWKTGMKSLNCQFDTQYSTNDASYMQYVWKVFKEIYDAGYVYKSIKILPYSTGLKTTLSHMEATNNYKNTETTSVYVAYKCSENICKFIDTQLNESQSNTYHFLVWTTTPWTLPTNFAIGFNHEIEYVIIEMNHIKTIVSKQYAKKHKSSAPFKFEEREFNNAYTNHFDSIYTTPSCYFVDCSFVDTGKGTGLVHLSPCFGADDYEALKHIVDINDLNVIDENGCYTKTMYAGNYVFNINENVIAHLGVAIMKKDVITHEYPYCYRTDTPLIYSAHEAYFVNIQEFKREMLEHIKTVEFSPKWIATRLEHGIKTAPDWNISRNRFWGCAIPLYTRGDDTICSTNSEKMMAHNMNRVNQDGYEWIGLVFDCWFESGCAMSKYWRNDCKNIAIEGIDQTRGWYYSSLAISTILARIRGEKIRYADEIKSHGFINDENGHKLSKHSQNYSPTNKFVSTYKTDAIRLYFFASPATGGSNMSMHANKIVEYQKNIFFKWDGMFKLFNELLGYYSSHTDFIAYQYEAIDHYAVQILSEAHAQMTDAMCKGQYGNISSILTSVTHVCTEQFGRVFKHKATILKMNGLEMLAYVLTKFGELIHHIAPNIAEQCMLGVKVCPINNRIDHSFKDELEIVTVVNKLRRQHKQPRSVAIETLCSRIDSVAIRVLVNAHNIVIDKAQIIIDAYIAAEEMKYVDLRGAIQKQRKKLGLTLCDDITIRVFEHGVLVSNAVFRPRIIESPTVKTNEFHSFEHASQDGAYIVKFFK